ncbi:MAG: hypothetical protein FWB75_05040 [Oscillospiraceae bacterium]|nr:hypothetical protein [Oscillospiraceae bacterium]
MTKLHIGPAMRYQWNYMWKSGLAAAGVMLAIMIILAIILTVTVTYTGADGYIVEAVNEDLNLNIDFSGSLTVLDAGGIFTMMLFIVGIVSVREDLKFFIQHGMGRKTTYAANILISLICAAGASLISLIFLLISEFIPLFHVNLTNIFSNNPLVSWLLSTLSMFFAWQLGSLISLIYYRLNTLAKVIFSIAAAALFLFVLRGLFSNLLDVLFPGYTTFWGVTGFFGNPVNLALTLLAAGIVCSIGNFLLIRRAPIKE